jgi:uncharacterized protein YqjF (DUF2071 family)
MPERPWLLGQTWEGLLFAHWRVPAAELRTHVPTRLELEEWDGSAWLGLTPFRVAGFRLRGLPPPPLLSSFHELNCRTYVRRDDRPGIWFFSLDASSRFAVVTARRTYGLPYRHAHVRADDSSFALAEDGRAFGARYQGDGEPRPPSPGTLEHFLTERYCLYGRDGTLRGDIHHPPWPLERAEADVTMRRLAPVPVEGEPICHFAARQDVVVWPPVRLAEMS